MAEYEELLKIVDLVENSSTKQELNFLDMSSIMSAPRPQAKIEYGALLKTINEVESVQKSQKDEQLRERQRVEESYARQAELQVMQQQHEAMQQQQALQQVAQQQQQPQQQTKEPVYEKYEDNITKHAETVKNELGSLAKSLGAMKPRISELRIRRINTKDLVLPSLSVSDQISELERIIEGLRQGVFDADHLGIVTQEVYGLSQVTKEERRKPQQQVEGLEQSLSSVRDQRITEAISLLQGNVAR